MDEPLAIMIAVINTVFILSGAGVLKYWLKLRHERHHMPKIEEQLKSLRDSVDEIRDHLEPQILELQERLDFAERVLTRGAGPHDSAPGSTPI